MKSEILFYYPVGHQQHRETGHVECPERVDMIREALCVSGLWNNDNCVNPFVLNEQILFAVHEPEYISELKQACERGQPLDHDTYTTPHSWEIAINSAGGAVALAAAVWRREAKRGFALTRPPGHHATSTHGMGFCLLNNIALAAQYLTSTERVKKLAIIDFDLHHGNGTQQIFWERGDVFYISIHQSPLFPGTGRLDETGRGLGENTTANFPLPPGSGDRAYDVVINELILPILNRYKPEMLLISLGYDAHWRDKMGHLRLSAGGYGDLIGRLTTWSDQNCGGRIALFLEGGYDIDVCKVCSVICVSAILGIPFNDPIGLTTKPEGNSWQTVVQQAKELWKV